MLLQEYMCLHGLQSFTKNESMHTYFHCIVQYYYVIFLILLCQLTAWETDTNMQAVKNNFQIVPVTLRGTRIKTGDRPSFKRQLLTISPHHSLLLQVHKSLEHFGLSLIIPINRHTTINRFNIPVELSKYNLVKYSLPCHNTLTQKHHIIIIYTDINQKRYYYHPTGFNFMPSKHRMHFPPQHLILILEDL